MFRTHPLFHRRSVVPAIAASIALVCASHAIADDADTALASYGGVKIMRSDYEADILRIPERDRLGWAMSQDRINKEIDGLLRFRAIADAAKKEGLDADPTLKKRLALLEDRLLAEALIAKIDAASEKEFEAKRPIFVERAREKYLVTKQTYMTPPEVRVSHLLITTNGRTADEALTKIKALREKIVGGASFEEVALANSEDPSVRANKGDLGFFAKGHMDPVFETAAFAMKTRGEISEPVKTRFGYHLIRFEDRKEARQLSFEEASPDLMEKLKAQYVDMRRNDALKATYDPAKVQWNEPAVVALRKHVDPALLKGMSQ